MKKLLFAILFFGVIGCSSNGGGTGVAAGTIAKGADENGVSVNKNSFMTTADTYKIALAHCLKFNRTPELSRKASALDFWMRDQYRCVKGSAD